MSVIGLFWQNDPNDTNGTVIIGSECEHLAKNNFLCFNQIFQSNPLSPSIQLTKGKQSIDGFYGSIQYAVLIPLIFCNNN